MSDLLSLVSAIPNLMNLFSGGTTAPYRQQQEQIAGRQNQLSHALTDTNNPLYQQMYGQYKNQASNNLAQSISELQGQNRLNSGMGRTPLLSRERGGEDMFRAITQGYQNQGVQADQQARSAITQAMGGNTQALAGYNSISPYGAAGNKSQLLGYQGIYDLLRGNQAPQASQLTAPNSAPNANTNGAMDYSSLMRLQQPQSQFLPSPQQNNSSPVQQPYYSSYQW